MHYKVKWDNIGPEWSLENEEEGLSYREAILFRRKLERDIDVVHVKIINDKKRREKRVK